MLNLVLYQPDIPQNFGACLRLSACMGATIHVIEPCGFVFDDTKMRRAGMDYIHKASYIRHLNWAAFLEYRTNEASRLREPSAHEVAPHGEVSRLRRGQSEALDHRQDHPGRLLLLETDGTTRYTDITYQWSDYIVLGRESAGTPRELYDQMDLTLTIPMREGVRSLNVAMSAGMITAEACRQQEWRW